ncbi:unnamed protein product [Arabidopsis halleri]
MTLNFYFTAKHESKPSQISRTTKLKISKINTLNIQNR